jgi:hypothetical protein
VLIVLRLRVCTLILRRDHSRERQRQNATLPIKEAMSELSLEVLTHLCQHLDLRDLVRVSASCKRFRHGGLETVELPTESPVVTALLQHAFPRPELIPSMRPADCLDSWVAYLARNTRQRHCREDSLIAAGWTHNRLVDAAGRLLSCGTGAVVGHRNVEVNHSVPTPVAAMAGVRVRGVAAGRDHSLALAWDGRVYSWGWNGSGSWATETGSTGGRRSWWRPSRGEQHRCL